MTWSLKITAATLLCDTFDCLETVIKVICIRSVPLSNIDLPQTGCFS